MAKRYYWLKLSTDFFDQKEIKFIRRIAGGDTYTIIYLKMLLKSVNSDGKLYFDNVADDFSEEIAMDIDEDVQNVNAAIVLFKRYGLINEGFEEIEMTKTKQMIGSESASAERMRRSRDKAKLENKERHNVTHELRTSDVEKSREEKSREDVETETAAAELINKLNASLSKNRIRMTDLDKQALMTELHTRGQGVADEEVMLMFDSCLLYAVKSRVDKPVMYALARLSGNIDHGYRTLEAMLNKESMLHSMPEPEEIPDTVAFDVDVQNVDWSKF